MGGKMERSMSLFKTKSKPKYFKRSATEQVYDFLNALGFIAFTLLCVFPFYYLFINTISDNELVVRGLINFLPQGLNISNYVALKDIADLGTAFLVTIARTIVGTALMVAVSALAGYLVTKQKLWLRKFWYRFLIITMYFNAGLIPW